MQNQALRADVLMLLTAIIWGSAFVAQRLGMDHIGPFLYTGLRFALAALVLVLITFLVLSLQQRLRMFPMWQQSTVLLVVFGLAQLVQLWLNALTGSRPPTLAFVLPALVSALLWPMRVEQQLSGQARQAWQSGLQAASATLTGEEQARQGDYWQRFNQNIVRPTMSYQFTKQFSAGVGYAWAPLFFNTDYHRTVIFLMQSHGCCD